MNHPFESHAIMNRLLTQNENRLDQSFPQQPDPYIRLPTATGESIPLPPPVHSGRPLAQVLQDRSSCRFYGDLPVTLQDVGTMLSCAALSDQADQQYAEAVIHPLIFFVVGWRILELQESGPRVYWYDAVRHSLQPVGPAPPPAMAADQLVLQREFAYAPLLVLIVGNLASALFQQGGFGHRQLLVRAGAAGNRLLLSALSLGLVGNPFGGVIPQAVNQLCQLDGFRLRCLFGVAVGHPTDRTA